MTGTVHLAGLTDDVEVHRDEWGIPHVRARSADDAFFAQGYVHAQDRLFQMTVLRRAAQGRLAEIHGPRALPVDDLARRLLQLAGSTVEGVPAGLLLGGTLILRDGSGRIAQPV